MSLPSRWWDTWGRSCLEAAPKLPPKSGLERESAVADHHKQVGATLARSKSVVARLNTLAVKPVSGKLHTLLLCLRMLFSVAWPRLDDGSAEQMYPSASADAPRSYVRLVDPAGTMDCVLCSLVVR